MTGLDLFYQNDDRINYAVQGTRARQRLLTPDHSAAGYALVRDPRNRRVGDGANLGYFLSDRVWFADQFSILGGFRYDRFVSSYAATTTGLFGPRINADSNAVSPKVAAIFEPSKDQTFYISYSKGFTPQGAYVANSTGIEVPSVNALKPEESNLTEAGAKVSLFDGRLGLAGALFKVDKSNSFDVDPVTGGLILGALDAGEKRRVQGLELTATGKLTENWSLLAGYTYLQGRVLSGTYRGNVAPFVPENAFSLWTTYDLSRGAGRPGTCPARSRSAAASLSTTATSRRATTSPASRQPLPRRAGLLRAGRLPGRGQRLQPHRRAELRLDLLDPRRAAVRPHGAGQPRHPVLRPPCSSRPGRARPRRGRALPRAAGGRGMDRRPRHRRAAGGAGQAQPADPRGFGHRARPRRPDPAGARPHSPLFNAAALPLRVLPPLFNRYDVGMGFRNHVDGAVRAIPGLNMRMRADVSTTLFLTAPEDYDGASW